MTGRTITIDYLRPPDRLQRIEQLLLAREGSCTVTFLPRAVLSRPVAAGGVTVLEPEAPVVWFTWPGRWYDVGRFHLRDGTFTGFYANVLTPVEMSGDRWRTTDLFLDVWVGADGRVELLDEEEFAQALDRGWLERDTAERARATAASLLAAARLGTWPPAEVLRWTLAEAERAAALG